MFQYVGVGIFWNGGACGFPPHVSVLKMAHPEEERIHWPVESRQPTEEKLPVEGLCSETVRTPVPEGTEEV